MKLSKDLKIRKEDFGYLACNITNCEVYEISNFTASIILLLKKKSLNELKENDLQKIGRQHNLSPKETIERFNELIKKFGSLGWMK